MKAGDRVAELTSAVRAYAVERWGSADIELVAKGTEYYLFRVLTAGGPLALKCASEAFISDDIDDAIDTSSRLEQEATVLHHLRSRGASVPECLGYARARGFPLCAMDFVEGDGTVASDFSIGQALRRVHGAGAWPVPGLGSFDIEASFKTTVVRRIRAWLGKLISQRQLEASFMAVVQPALFSGYSVSHLTTLHLDIRHPNIVTRRGGVAAILDWGNSMIGDPWLDILRVDEFSELAPARFLAGYGSLPPRPPIAVEHAYRLYTTSMLSLLFKDMVPDPERRAMSIKRVRDSLAVLLKLPHQSANQ